jgi:hypothetical protein
MICPVTYDEAAEARNATIWATSAVVPIRPTETASNARVRAAAGMAASISVSIIPGDTALTSTPWPASSRESARVRPMSPALDAA